MNHGVKTPAATESVFRPKPPLESSVPRTYAFERTVDLTTLQNLIANQVPSTLNYTGFGPFVAGKTLPLGSQITIDSRISPTRRRM
jgi:hypothetical protein